MNTTPLRAGAASPRTASSSSRPEPGAAARQPALPLEVGLLLGAGALAALLHLSLRWPMKMPGHHGLEWLALLMAARLLSNRPWAALAVALGAAATALAGGGGGDALLRPAIYLLQGAALDLLWTRLPARALWQAALAGAAVHALSPLLKAALAAGGAWQAGALAGGLALPLSTHAAYGAAGAAAAALAVAGWRRANRANRTRR